MFLFYFTICVSIAEAILILQKTKTVGNVLQIGERIYIPRLKMFMILLNHKNKERKEYKKLDFGLSRRIMP
jgi:hypothetical protein